jgi:dTMP kinase
LFIAVDGIDGAGKTTLVKQLVEFVGSENAISTKEPTESSEWGMRLRDSARLGRLPRKVEVEYFHRDRLYHIGSVIQPNLQSGRIVITDRYVDSTLAFQADSPAEAEELYRQFLPEILVPDITFILDCSVEIGLSRIRRDRMSFSKFEEYEFLENASQIYRSRRGSHYVHLDAEQTPQHTFDQATEALRSRFQLMRANRRQPTMKRNQGKAAMA